MIEHEKLSFLSIATAVAVVVAMYIFSDVIKAALTPAESTRQWGRNRWLRLVGREEYVGAHRYRRFA